MSSRVVANLHSQNDEEFIHSLHNNVRHTIIHEVPSLVEREKNISNYSRTGVPAIDLNTMNLLLTASKEDALLDYLRSMDDMSFATCAQHPRIAEIIYTDASLYKRLVSIR